MKRKKVKKGSRKLTPLQLAIAELKTPKRVDNRPITLTDFIKNRLIPQLNAKKKKPVLCKGKVVDVYEFPDNRARLKAIDVAAWMYGAYGPTAPIPAELKAIRFIVHEEDDAACSEASTASEGPGREKNGQ